MEKADFMQALEEAIAAKASEFDSKRLPDMLESYRLLHTCAKNLFELLLKRSLIKDDPYKLETKVTKIETPDTGAFNETETATIMGIRLSAYDTMLDYICGYLPVNTESLDEGKIKKLLDFNGFIEWGSMSANSTHVNTRVLCELIAQARNGAQQLTQRSIIDSLNNAKKAQSDINITLADLAIFEHENAKYKVRSLVIGNAMFDSAKAAQSGEAERSEIKRLWSTGMGKVPYNNDLVLEIVKEDTDSDADSLHQAVLARLKSTVPTKKAEKARLDPKRLLVDAAVIIAASNPQLEQVLQKISYNHDLLAASRATLFEKFKAALRRAFGIADPPEEYVLTMTNQKTQARTTRRIDYNEFFIALEKRMKVYAALANQTSAQYARIASSPTSVLFAFMTKQVTEMLDVVVLLDALDEYFKTNIVKTKKGKAKGLKIELATISNCVIKARGRCADFTAEMEEEKKRRAIEASQGQGAAQGAGAAQGQGAAQGTAQAAAPNAPGTAGASMTAAGGKR